jgi:3-oxoacyl-[acyl-carrier protein] reductase
MDLANRIAIVTGGATGIGKAITQALVKQGCHVVINYNTSAAAAEALVAEIIATGGKAIAVQADVSKLEDAKRLVDATLSTFGGLNIVVNNAGIVADNLMLRMSEDQFDKVINTNLKGVWNVCKSALKPLLKSDYARIVNISSVSGVVGNAGQTNYSAAKAGIIGLTKALAREVASRGVTVNAVAPGFIETAMTGALTPEVITYWQQAIPLKRFGKPEDVAQAVVFLVGPNASYITGHVLEVDGGIVM